MTDTEPFWQPPPVYSHLLGLRSSRRYLLDELDNLSKRQELVRAELARVDGEIRKAGGNLTAAKDSAVEQPTYLIADIQHRCSGGCGAIVLGPRTCGSCESMSKQQ